MNEQRRQILEMLAEGKITADEAERLIEALQREQPEAPPGAARRRKARPTYLRVVVNWQESTGGDGPGRVNVRVPLQLLRAGVRLTSLVPPQALTRVNAQLSRSGVPIDLTELRQRDIEDLIEQLDEVDIDVDDPEASVRVFCE
ncbi:SHOCT-like domain-containing protein [Streptomyces hoynatensis]|uniref:YvlB/LiaX N-terminal domain-containing protein n=1 Tax=Streptomyces hoynatensis TaxID=1141874 RepID=A0A3A9Z7K9_9ACTN|nr:hypothetical protein [Streptomyces hoynatensis]RKN43854.1 hypothetical protein D7294_09090 [Streptomyces hoynatensis]